MAKVRVRKLWIKMQFSIPRNVSKQRIIETLRRSIERQIDDGRGDYKLPKGWRVVINWKNAAGAKWRRGEWQAELLASEDAVGFGSTGFAESVLDFLDKKE